MDSAVCAHLLKEAGHDVVGVFLRTWDERDPDCPQSQDRKDAQAVAEHLGIPFYSFDVSHVYRDEVFAFFLSEIKKGRTPNPDIWCNRQVKFGAFWGIAKELNCTHIATGHYAKVGQNAGEFTLEKPKDASKDQTYFLYTLNQSDLSRVVFPLADLPKTEVREIAETLDLPNAKKKDSVGICMVGDRDFRSFVAQYLPQEPGEIKEIKTEEVLGKHVGGMLYTPGQRKGLNVGGVKNRPDAPWFVVKTDIKTNTVWVSQDEADLIQTSAKVVDLRWTGAVPASPLACLAQVRYRSPAVPATATFDESTGEIAFHDGVRAIAVGQSVVFYDEKGRVIGGGIVDESA